MTERPADLGDRAVEMLARLIAHPTVSEDSNLALIDEVRDLLGAVGYRITTTVDRSGTKANLFASIGPESDGGVVLSGHTDVVPVEGQDWSRDPFHASVEDGRVWGRGSSDMKGFIACVLASAPAFASVDLSRPVHIALTYDEEVGCHGAALMLEELDVTGPHPEIALIGEPTGMSIKAGHKGCNEYTTEFHGLERHASQPVGPAGAIDAAARFVVMLDGLGARLAKDADPASPFDPRGTTINVGRFDGGVARNITAASASVEWEVRPARPGDGSHVLGVVEQYLTEELLPDMRAVYRDAAITTTTVGEVSGLLPEPDSPAVSLARRLVGSEETGVVSFGTEAGLYQERGISAVVCGPGDIDQAHKPDEFVEISQLEACLRMLDRLRDELAA